MVEVIWVGEERDVPEGVKNSDLRISVIEKPEEAYERIDDGDCVVLSHRVGGTTPTGFFERVRQESPDVPCVLFGGSDSHMRKEDADVVFDYVPGEDNRDLLPEVIWRSVENRTHLSYPLPENEESRIRQLSKYDNDEMSITDTFDRLSALGARLLDGDWAFVGLIDKNKDRLLSCYGRDIEEIDRQETVCTYNILDEGPMTVENLSKDPRFEDNYILDKLGMMSYLGAPITTPSGARIGTFCVFDSEPREFTDEEIESIEILAEETAEQLRLREMLSSRKEYSEKTAPE